MSHSHSDSIPLGAMVQRDGAPRAERLVLVDGPSKSFWSFFLPEAPWTQGSLLLLWIVVFEALRISIPTYSWWVAMPGEVVSVGDIVCSIFKSW